MKVSYCGWVPPVPVPVPVEPPPIELPPVDLWVVPDVVCFLLETRCTLLLVCAEATFLLCTCDLLVAVLPVVPISVEAPGVVVLVPVDGVAGWVCDEVCARAGSAAKASAPARSRLREVVSIFGMAVPSV